MLFSHISWHEFINRISNWSESIVFQPKTLCRKLTIFTWKKFFFTNLVKNHHVPSPRSKKVKKNIIPTFWSNLKVFLNLNEKSLKNCKKHRKYFRFSEMSYKLIDFLKFLSEMTRHALLCLGSRRASPNQWGPCNSPLETLYPSLLLLPGKSAPNTSIAGRLGKYMSRSTKIEYNCVHF